MSYKDPEKQREYQRLLVAKTRRDWLAVNGPCKCGSTKNLQVDHVDPKKKVDHKVRSWAPARRAEELAKCQVLCKVCHLKKTIVERTPDHGTNSRYTSKVCPCRCDLCRAAHAATNAQYKKAS